MYSLGPMAVAIDWLDAYRAASIPEILNLYDGSAAVECSCGGHKTIVGKTAIAAYWHQRFQQKPAGELVDLEMDGETIVIAYQVPQGQVKAVLYFAPTGKILRSICGPEL
jgi:ketosteroid isomerase-like protein